MEQEALFDRREYERFRLQDRAWVAVVVQTRQVFQLIDIGKGGLSFTYMSDDPLSKEAQEMDLLLVGHGVLLKNIPFEIVSDSAIEQDNAFSTVRTRRCCVQFKELTDDQMCQLEDFLRKFTDRD